MFTPLAVLKNLLNAATSRFGGAADPRIAYLRKLQADSAGLAQFAAAYHNPVQTLSTGTGALATDTVNFDTAQLLGDGITYNAATGEFTIRDPGDYEVQFDLLFTAPAGPAVMSVQGYLNGNAAGSTGAIAGSNSSVIYTAALTPQVVGTFPMGVTVASSLFGLRNVSGASRTLPAVAAAGNAIAGSNAQIAIRRVG